MILDDITPEKPASVETALLELSKNVQSLYSRVSAIERRLIDAAQKADRAVGLCNGELLEQAKEDAASVHELYRLSFLKLTVATEVLWLERREKSGNPELAMAVILAFDHDADWWISRANWPLSDWVREIRKIARSRKL